MTLSLKQLLTDHQGSQHDLYADQINPQLVRVLRTIGFDKNYVRGHGALLYDADNNDYLDLLSGYGVFALGRSHPEIRQVLHEALDIDYPNMIQMDAPLIAGLLAKKLTRLMPDPIDTVFFTNSGAEANEAAIKFAKKSTGRNRIVYWDHAFHGLTNGALSLNGGTDFKRDFGPLLPECTMIPMGDIDALKKELETSDVAAFICEPIQGKGVYYAETQFYQEAQRLCRKYGTLLICDEVQSGLCRTGKMFAYEHFGIEPDMICIAKALSGGFIPIGALCYSKKIYHKVYKNMEECVVHSNTFGRNIMACAAGLATLEIMERDRLADNARIMGQKIMDGLTSLVDKYEMLSDIRGKGLMIGIEFCEPKSLRLKTGWKLIHALNAGLFSQMIIIPLMTDHRILTQVAGHNMDIIKLLPPLIIDDTHVNRFLNAFEDVVKQCHRFPGTAWQVGKDLAKAAIKNR